MKSSRWFKATRLLPIIALLIAGGSLPAYSQTRPVRVSVKPLDLSKVPTTEEIMAAGQLGGELHTTHAFRDKGHQAKVNHSFAKAIQAWNKHEYKDAAALFQAHVKQYPDSPWNSEALLHIGCNAQYHGRNSEAEEAFQWILKNNKGKDHHGAKVLLNKARLRLGVLRILQDDFAEAQTLFHDLKAESPDWRHRTYAAHWIQRLSQESSELLAMRNCGNKALAYLLEKRGSGSAAMEILSILPDTDRGHSLDSLSGMAARYGYDLVALRISLPEIGVLALPAIMHISGETRGDRGHYWVLDKADKDGLDLFDPQSNTRFRQTPEEFSREWSGIALVFSDAGPLPGTRLSRSETAPVSGGCCGQPRPETNQGNPGRNSGPSPRKDGCDQGAPKWSVNMVNMNLVVQDTPLWYTTPIGPEVAIRLTYNSQSATAYHEPFGNKWMFNYGSYLVVDPSQTVTIFMPDGRRDVYRPAIGGGYTRPYQVFNTLAKLAENHFELRFPDDTVYVYGIPEGTTSLQPFLVEIRDAHGQSVEFGYDANVQLASITDAMGRTTTLTYDAGGLVTRVTDPFGRSAAFEYDAGRNLTKITDMGGYWSKLSYDADIYLTGLENSRGKWQFTIEPADGIVAYSDDYPPPGGPMWQNYRITVTDPLGGKYEYFYYGGLGPKSWYVSPRDYVPWVSSGFNGTNNFRKAAKTVYWNTRVPGKGEISQIDYPAGGSVAYTYDTKGNRTSATDAHNGTTKHTTTYTYNDLGRVTSVTDPTLVRTDLVYAANGVDLLEVRNGLGSILMTTNGTHDVTSVRSRLGHTTTMAYNGYGQLTSVVDARGIPTTFVYSPDNQLERIERDGKVLESFTYDVVGRVRTRTDATGLALTFDYDNLNHVTRTTTPDERFPSTTYAGCCPRLIESVTDRSGRTTRYDHDELERLKDVIDPAGGVTRFLRDDNGNLAWLVDPNKNVTSFEYDLNNRLVKKKYADGTFVSFEYDGANLVTRRTNARGIVTLYTYDQNDRLKTVAYSDGTPNVTFDYDAFGRLVQRQDGTGTTVYTYDADSRQTAMDGPWTNDTLTFRYDEEGQTGLRTGIGIEGGQSVSYAYDSLNRLTAVQIGSNAYSYAYSEASPLIAALGRPNGSATTYRYDSLNRLLEIANTNSTGSVINRYVYGYDDQDLRSSESRTNAGEGLSFENSFTSHDINALNQVLNGTDPEQAYAYDADGNMVRGVTPEGYAFTAAFDAENRLVSLEYTESAGVVRRAEYSYAGTGALAVAKTFENGALVDETRVVRNGFLALQERDGTNNARREYTWGLDIAGGIGGLLNLRQGGQDYSYLYDGRGNVSALIDSAQNVVAAYTYDAFGNTLSKIGTLDQPYRFSTKEYNDRTGLSYYGYRFYSPALGRWLTRDPLGERGGINLYGFVQNDPVNLVDPYGLDATTWNNTTGGRSRWNGPTNGNWGGKCWSGGQYSCGGNPMGNAPPTDTGDACYERHDKCYDRCGASNPQCIAACDQQLVNELRNLSDDPRLWLQPPRLGTEGDSRRYRDMAIRYFR